MPKVASAKSTGSTGRRTKKEKDPNAPKRNLSAYFLFSAEERPKIKKSDPTLNMADTAKELGRRWKLVDADVKNKFQKLADKDKERYTKEKAAYEGGSAPAKSSAKAPAAKAPAAKAATKAPAAKATAKPTSKAPVPEDDSGSEDSSGEDPESEEESDE